VRPAAGALIALAFAADARAQGAELDRVVELRAHLSRCLTQRALAHPAMAQPAQGVTVTLRFALKRNGELLGEPHFTYRGALEHARRIDLQLAMASALTACTPVRVTDGLGGAIAGRPLTVNFRDPRGQRAI
jgi:hypothetical protein